MLKLKDIAKYYRKRYFDKDPKHNIIAYPSFNALTAFIKCPLTDTFICVFCSSRKFTNNDFFRLKNNSDKTPVEFIQEAFYYNKIRVLPTKVKSKVIGQLMKKLHLTGIIKNDIDGLEIIKSESNVDNDKKIIPSLTKNLQKFETLYTSLFKQPSKYFELKDYKNAKKSDIKKAKQRIFKVDFKK